MRRLGSWMSRDHLRRVGVILIILIIAIIVIFIDDNDIILVVTAILIIIDSICSSRFCKKNMFTFFSQTCVKHWESSESKNIEFQTFIWGFGILSISAR